MIGLLRVNSSATDSFDHEKGDDSGKEHIISNSKDIEFRGSDCNDNDKGTSKRKLKRKLKRKRNESTG